MIKSITKKVKGFVYLPQFDYSDDGIHFTMWMYKGIPISQHRSKVGTFICFRYDYLTAMRKANLTDITMDAPWEMWSETAAYKLGDKFNGVDGFEIEDLMSSIEEYREGIIAVNKKFADTRSGK